MKGLFIMKIHSLIFQDVDIGAHWVARMLNATLEVMLWSVKGTAVGFCSCTAEL